MKFLPSFACVSFVLLGLLHAGCSEDEPTNGSPPPDDTSRHTSWRRARLLISDGNDHRLRVFDVEDDEVTATLDLGNAGSVEGLEVSETGNVGIVRMAGGREAALVTSGVAIIDHVDHIHIYKSTPKLVTPRITAEVSLRIAGRDGFLGVFRENQGSSTSSRIKEVDLLTPTDASGSPEVALPDLARHRGIVLPVRDRLLITRPLEGAAGVSVELRSTSGALERDLGTCDFAGGVAASRDQVTLACANDFLRLAYVGDAGAPEASRLPYPAGMTRPPEALEAHFERGIIVARIASHQWLRIGPQGDAAIVPLPLPPASADACDMAIEPGRGERLLVLTTDGVLRDISIATGTETKNVAVTPPFACDARSAHPHLALAPERAYVTSPTTGELVDIDLNAMQVFARKSLTGAPNDIAPLGLDVKKMNVAPGAAHDGF